MKLAVCLLLAVAASAYGATIEYDTALGWYVPQLTGGFKWMPKEEFEEEGSQIDPRAVTVKFYLYTKSNPTTPKQINVNDATALSSSNFNKANPTRFVIHGWTNNYKSEVNQYVRSALLASGSYNVFCVDWSGAASLAYSNSRASVPEVGQMVANFIDFLNEKGGMSFSNVGLIGHSLGAHVSGYAGKSVKRGKVNTIIGLDPALPGYSYSNCATRLCSSDAGFVESIHTNGGLLGFLEPIGKAAFYPNGGKKQPGCGLDLTGGCSHGRAYMYYAEALQKNDFPSMKCTTYQNAVADNCGSTYSSVRMGSSSNYGVSGYYYVPVKSSSPYGMAS